MPPAWLCAGPAVSATDAPDEGEERDQEPRGGCAPPSRMKLDMPGVETRRLSALAELAPRRARPCARFEQVVAPIIGQVGHLLLERSSALEHVPIEERRTDPLTEGEELAPATDHDLAAAMLG